MAPANKLPTELLAEVFLILKRTPVRWYSCLSVCKYWRMVALTSPQLWRMVQVDKHTPPACLTNHLERSGSAGTLEVTFKETRSFADHIVYLLPSLARLRSLKLVDIPIKKAYDVQCLLKNPIPSLEVLHVIWDREKSASRWPDEYSREYQVDPADEVFCMDIAIGQFPVLQELSLRTVAITVEPRALCTLRRLYLRDCIEPDFTCSNFLSMLQDCVSLEELSLYRFRPSGYLPEPPTPEDPDVLLVPPYSLAQTLRKFVLTDIERYTRMYLINLLVPPTADLFVTKLNAPDVRNRDWQPGDIEGVPLHTALPLDLVEIPILDHVQCAVVDLRDFEERISVVGTFDSRTVCVAAEARYPCDFSPHYRQDLCELFYSAPLVDLQILGAGEPEEEDVYLSDEEEESDQEAESAQMQWMMALDPHIGLQRLAVSSQPHCNVIKELLSALGSKFDDGEVPCPNLQELRITVPILDVHTSLSQHIIPCLQERAASGSHLDRLFVSLGTEEPVQRKPKEPKQVPPIDPDIKLLLETALKPLVDTVHVEPHGTWFSSWDHAL
ncbi:hypothetical protein C8Q76DRAFT_738232 [Earliella scabrosa]|nr:hypothetical protein C8Q76DRAFT_738232 [Earliella scabrosa]